MTLYFTYRKIQSWRFKKQLPELKKSGAIIIDVRSPAEYASGHAPETLNIPLQNLSNEISKIPKDKSIVVCCASGTRSSMAMGILKRNGLKNIYNAGSWTSLT
jgi:rhodanese-related sulfurtransferase